MTDQYSQRIRKETTAENQALKRAFDLDQSKITK